MGRLRRGALACTATFCSADRTNLIPIMCISLNQTKEIIHATLCKEVTAHHGAHCGEELVF